jgi:cell wall-associated NlpC family hydrolase
MAVAQPTVDRFETAESAARTTARILDLAESYVGTPYLSGGTNPSIGFDAAGFVQYVFARERVMLPRTSHAIAELGEEVSTRIGSLRPGDLLFFGNSGTGIDHVAIYAGHDRIIHATASGNGVRYDVLGEDARGEWFSDHLVTARRIIAEGRERPRVRRDDSRGEGELDVPDRAPRVRGE